MHSRRGRLLAGLSALLLASACADGRALLPVERAPDPLVASYVCRVSVDLARIDCGVPDAVRGDLILAPGRDVQVEVVEGSVRRAGDSLSFDVRVRNLLRQPAGTFDGTTPSDPGVRVFFSQAPEATQGTGPIEVANADGTETFLAAAQPFFAYPGILPPGAVSAARTWRLIVGPEVRAFDFALAVIAPVPAPLGYVQLAPDSLVLAVGGAAALVDTVRDGHDQPQPQPVESWESSDSAVATVDASGRVRARAPGTATVTARSGDRLGRAMVRVCGALAPGESRVLDEPAELCVGADSAGAAYLLVAGNPAPTPIGISALARGIQPAEPALSRAPAPGGRDPEAALLERERRELAPLLSSSRGPLARPLRSVAVAAPALGTRLTLNVATGCAVRDDRAGRVVAVGTHVVLVADSAAPAGGFTDVDWRAIAAEYDSLVHPAVTGSFGAPLDLDGNGRVIAFYTPAVNQLTPAGSTSYLGGYVQSRDVLAKGVCGTSNEAEVLYMLVPDPAGGINGNVRSVELVRGQTVALLAHELQHVVNAEHHVYHPGGAITPEEPWLNEGLSHIAEELVFYRASGLTPGLNLDRAAVLPVLDPLLRHQGNNFYRLKGWLQAPEQSGPFASPVSSGMRGAAWSFLRYAADRRGGDQAAFWRSLVDGGTTGMSNLGAAIGADPREWWRDWTVATYADDTPAAGAAYGMPSWNARTLFVAGYPLAIRPLPDGVPWPVTLAGGAAAYLSFSVAPGGAARVSLSGDATRVLVRIR